MFEDNEIRGSWQPYTSYYGTPENHKKYKSQGMSLEQTIFTSSCKSMKAEAFYELMQEARTVFFVLKLIILSVSHTLKQLKQLRY